MTYNIVIHYNIVMNKYNYYNKRTVIDIYDSITTNKIHRATVFIYQNGRRIFSKRYDNHKLAIKDYPKADKNYDSELITDKVAQ